MFSPPLHLLPGSCLSDSRSKALRAGFTFTVAIIVHLDLGASKAGITVQLAVIQVRLAIAATHRPLMRFALLKKSQKEKSFTHRHGSQDGWREAVCKPQHQPSSWALCTSPSAQVGTERY